MPQLETSETPKAELPRAKTEGQARSLANLRPAKKGEVRNPTGKNGMGGPWRRYLDEPDPDEPGFASRRDVLMARLYEKAKTDGRGALLPFAIEQDQGRAKQAPSKLEVADHLATVARHQWVALIESLGDRLKTMKPEEAAEVIATLMRKADCRPERFLSMADKFMDVAEGSTEAKGATDNAAGLPQRGDEPSIQGQLRPCVPEAEAGEGTVASTASGDAAEQGRAAEGGGAGVPVLQAGEDE